MSDDNKSAAQASLQGDELKEQEDKIIAGNVNEEVEIAKSTERRVSKNDKWVIYEQAFTELTGKFMEQIEGLNTKIANLYGDLTLANARSTAVPMPPLRLRDGDHSSGGARDRRAISHLTAQVRHLQVDLDLIAKKLDESETYNGSLKNQLQLTTTENCQMRARLKEMENKLRHFEIDASRHADSECIFFLHAIIFYF